MPTKPISGSFDLSQSSQTLIINDASFLGYSFDLAILAGATATGTLSIYCQNINPASNIATYTPKQTYTITSGQFAGSLTGQTIDSAYLTSAQYCYIVWAGSSGAGALTIAGSMRSFS